MKICPNCQRTYADEIDFCPDDGMKLRLDRKSGPDPMIGRILDNRWLIEAKIGEGGMGAVYRGRQQSVARHVAIKTLRPSLTDNDTFVDRFFREARIATTINHPHCVTILDFGQDQDETLYLAMEYLEGTTLSARMEEPLTIEEILKIGQQIASALSAAHQANIVHRDLKPDNIFLLDIAGGGTFVKVLDFGIAKVMNSETQFTQTGQIFGTPDYMSPEQCQGTELDGRADLYALGCILYELFGGRPPFRRETPMAVLMAHVFEPVEPLQRRLPAAVEALVVKLLAKDPAERYPDAGTVRAAIEDLLATLEPAVLAYVPDQIGTGTLELQSPLPTPTPPAQLRGPLADTEETPKRHIPAPDGALDDDGDDAYRPPSALPKVLGILAAALIVAVAVVGFVFMSNPDENPAPPNEENAAIAAEPRTDPEADPEADPETVSKASEEHPEEPADDDLFVADAPAKEEPALSAKTPPPAQPPPTTGTAKTTKTTRTTKTETAPSAQPRETAPAPSRPRVLGDTKRILEDFSREVEEIERTIRPPATQPRTTPPTIPTKQPFEEPPSKKTDDESLFDFFGE